MAALKNYFLCFLLSSVTAVAVAPAFAQTISASNAMVVRNKILKDRDKTGVRLGSFNLSPVFEARAEYNDNIFRSRNNAKSDLITNYRPSLGLQSNWSRHSLFLGSEGDFGFYRDNGGQDYKDYGLLLAGQYDLMAETFLTGAVSQSRRHIGRGGLDDATNDEGSSASYKITSQIVGFTRALSYLKLRIFGQNSDTKVADDNNLSLFLTDDFVERNSQSLETEVRFEYMPGNSVFVSNILDTTDYSIPGQNERNSKGMNWKAGLNFDDGGVWNAKLFGGYLFRKYSDADKDTKRPYFGALVGYRLSRLTSLSLTYDKNFSETTIANAAGIVRTTHRLDIRHSLTEFLSATATIGYDDNDYVGGSSGDRETQFRYAGIRTDYDFSDKLGLRLSYDYRERTSNRPNDEYDSNRVMMTLTYSH